MFRSILVPLDGSVFAEQALPLALSIARRAKAGLRLVFVHVPLVPTFAETHPSIASTHDSQAIEREQAYLDSIVERLKQAAPVAVTTALPTGPVVETIQKEVTGSNADLVVMTTHGRGPLSRFWLGSVADELVRQCPAPLLLVRPHGTADLRQEVSVGRVIIPLDGSPLAEQILEPAVALGRLMGAEYTLLRVVQSVAALHIDYGHTPLVPEAQHWLQTLREVHERELQQARDYLEKVSPPPDGQAARIERKVASAEQPAGAILEEAGSESSNVIALATHGRRGLRRMVLGSVADKVVRGAAGPVLVYRPLERQ